MYKITNGVLFEWDDSKSLSNLKKHGLDFDEATKVWNDPMCVQAHLRSDSEKRWAVTGEVSKDVWLTVIITYRGKHVRIISARKASKKEVDVYAKNKR